MTETNWEQVKDAAAVLAAAAADLNRLLADEADEVDGLADLARTMLDMERAGRLVKYVNDELNTRASAAMEPPRPRKRSDGPQDDSIRVHGIAELTRQWKRSRTEWRNESLLADALKSLREQYEPDAVDPDTGERIHSWVQAVDAISTLFYLSGGNVRLTALRQAGLDEGDYCTQSPWRPLITVTELPPERDDQ